MSRGALAAGARTAGALVTLGFITGVVRGSLLGPIAGLILISFGHCLEEDAPTIARRMLATAAIVGAVGVAALRWNTLELGSIRGAQAVLGPTLLVGPDDVALAAGIAAAGGALALGGWATALSGGWVARTATALEMLVVGAVLATGFWGPALGDAPSASDALGGIGEWVAASLVAGLVAVAASFLSERRRTLRWSVTALGVVTVTVGAVLMAGTL